MANIPNLTISFEKLLSDLNDIRLAMKSSKFNRIFILILTAKLAIIGSVFPVLANKPKDFKLGAERMNYYLPLLEGKKVALVANPSTQINGQHLVDIWQSLDVNLVKVFAPEHGFRGDVEAGAHIKDGIDPKSKLPVVSLYGSNKKPKPEQLDGVDVIVFDIQDVGARFYTYISTLTYVMEAAAQSGVEVIVLDRPNPHANYIDGPVLEPAFTSFVGMHQVPVIHGCTMAEYAQMVNDEGWLANGVKCKLTIVKMKGYDRNMHYVLPISPSPNLPNDTAIVLYPSLCFLEGTPISIGRGTEKPFQIIGFKGFTGGDFTFTPRRISGKSEHPKFKNELCNGFYLDKKYDEILSSSNRQLQLDILINMYQAYPDKENFFTPFFSKLAGTKKLEEQIKNGLSQEQIRKSWQEDLNRYQKLREKYLLY